MGRGRWRKRKRVKEKERERERDRERERENVTWHGYRHINLQVHVKQVIFISHLNFSHSA